MMVLLISLFIIGWLAVSLIGTQAYFMGEQSKTIHERNWNSKSFDQIAKSITGKETDYLARIPAYSFDHRITRYNR